MIKGLLEVILGSADKKRKENWNKLSEEKKRKINRRNLILGLLFPIIVIIIAILEFMSE